MTEMQVKPLEWLDMTYGMQPHWTARYPFGVFDIRHEADQAWPWVVRPFITEQSNYKTLEEAKAAAETEYEARIRSALIPAPAVPDDVATWRQRADGFAKSNQTLRCDLTEAQRTIEAQAAELARYREALGPFAAVAEHDIGDDETDGEAFRPMQFVNRAPKLTVGDLRRARAALTQPTGEPK